MLDGMFEPIDDLPNGVIGFRARGRVTGADYASTLAPALEQATADGRKVRLLLELGEGFEGYDMSAMMADTGLGAHHLSSFEKMAVVTDAEWITHAIHLFGPLIPGEVRVFPVSDGATARDWVAG
jgi:hypothetical protein